MRSVLSRLLELMSFGMRLAEAHRHEVAEHGERGGRDLEQVGHAGPHGGVAGAGGLDGHALLEAAGDRVAGREAHLAGRALVGRGHVGPRDPVALASGISRLPRAALTVKISVLPTEPSTRAWVVVRPSAPMCTSRSTTAGGFV